MTLFLRNSPVAASANIESAHFDSRSPGYAARVVRYNEEQQQSPLFDLKNSNRASSTPVRSIFRNDFSLPRKRISLNSSQIKSPKLSKFNSPEHSRMLLETIIRSTPEKRSDHSHSEVTTKNVLEALKEISRKRIRVNEGTPKDDTRNSENWISEPNVRKKVRLNSSQPKNVGHYVNNCSLMDELKASHSSMERPSTVLPKKEQWHVHLTSTPVTHVKLIDVETQTILDTESKKISPIVEPKNDYKEETSKEETSKEETSKEETTETTNENVETSCKIKKTSPVKIFDETPLETMRKNRLTALMGSFAAEQTNKNQTPDEPTNHIVKHEDAQKPLVSILTKPDKNAVKSNKHVTFNIPNTSETVDHTNTSSASTFPMIFKDLNNMKSNNEKDVITKTSTALVTPIVSSNVVEASPRNVQTKDGNGDQFSPNYTVSQSNDQNQSRTTASTVVSSSENSMCFVTTSKPESPNPNFFVKTGDSFSRPSPNPPADIKYLFSSLNTPSSDRNLNTTGHSMVQTKDEFTASNSVSNSLNIGFSINNNVSSSADTFRIFTTPNATQSSINTNITTPACLSSTGLTKAPPMFTFSPNNLVTSFSTNSVPSTRFDLNMKPTFVNSIVTPTTCTPSTRNNTETSFTSPNLTFRLPTNLNNAGSSFGKTTTSTINSNDMNTVMSPFSRAPASPFTPSTASLTVNSNSGTLNVPTVTGTSSNNLFMHTFNFRQSPSSHSGIGAEKTQGSGFNNTSSSSIFVNNSPFGQTPSASNVNSGKDTSRVNNSLFSPFSTGTPSVEGNIFQTNSSQNTNNALRSGPFTSSSSTSPSVFTFGTSGNKSGSFSFGAEPGKQLFNFQTNNSSTAFDLTNRNVGLPFSNTGTGHFNNQTPTGMFTIGSGSAPPTRSGSRYQLKAKRRT